jgi:hypothetical protein
VSTRKWEKFVVFFLFSGCFNLGYGQAGRTRSDPELLQVKYAANPICGQVAKAVRAIHRSHPRGVYLTSQHERFLATFGLSVPASLQVFDPSLPQFTTGETKFLTVTTPGGDRLIAVEDTSLGSRGDYVTTVWIGKPRTRFAIQHGMANFGEQELTVPDPSVIDLVVDFQATFGWRSFTYLHATLPNARMRFDDAVAPTTETVNSVREVFNGYVAQEPFMFKGLLYFIAGDPLQGWFLVYRVETSANAQIECFARWASGSPR